MQHQHIFRGRRIQKGRGVGAIFGQLLRRSVPFLKTIGKYATKQLLTAGNDTINDISTGISVKDALRRNKLRTKERIIQDIKTKMSGGGRKRKKRTLKNKKPQKRRRKTSHKRIKHNKKRRKHKRNNKSSFSFF